MNLADVARLRLRNQRLAAGKFVTAEEAIAWLGAVQAQEYGLAKWSLGLRTDGLLDGHVDRLLAAGSILRTHILRPTWHFVLPADLRWMMKLTAPRIAAAERRAGRYLGDAVQARAHEAMRAELGGGRTMTRRQLADVLVRRGVVGEVRAAAPLFMHAELELVLCSGGLDGKAQTYALVDERAPALASFDRDWALAELTRRYFTGHGPATQTDLSWWSSLTLADIRRGIEINAAQGALLEAIEVEGAIYYWAGDTSDPAAPDDPSPTIHLLQPYDEYVIGYRAPRRPIDIAGRVPQALLLEPPYYNAMILDGQAAGWWRARPLKDRLLVDYKLVADLDAGQRAALEAAAGRYGAFVGMLVELA